MTKDDLPEFAKRMKFLRDRDQITITKLAQMTHYDKDRLRDFETGRAAPKDWEILTIAEAFRVKPDYFGLEGRSGGDSDAWRPPAVDKKGVRDRTVPVGPPHGQFDPEKGEKGKKKPKGMDFSEFDYFKERPEEEPASPPPVSLGSELADEERPLAPDLFEESGSAFPALPHGISEQSPLTPVPSRFASSGGRSAAPPPPPPPPVPPPARPAQRERPRVEPAPMSGSASRRMPKPKAQPAPEPRPAPPPPPVPLPPPPRPQPMPKAVEAPEPPSPVPAPSQSAADARVAAIESLVYVKALSEVLLNRGLFTGEEFAKALRRARGG